MQAEDQFNFSHGSFKVLCDFRGIEPARTHIQFSGINQTEQTIKDNARFFTNADEVPRFAITMGVGTIMEAKRIILLASGRSKAAIIAEAIEGPITAQVSASVLQMHREVVVIVDADAGSKLKRADYYRWIFENEPA